MADPEVLSMMDDLDEIPPDLLPAWIRRSMEQGWSGRLPAHAAANLRRVWDAGIRVVVGSDAGNIGTLHGPAIFREMASMVRAGLTPLEVLRAATLNAITAPSAYRPTVCQRLCLTPTQNLKKCHKRRFTMAVQAPPAAPHSKKPSLHWKVPLTVSRHARACRRLSPP